MKNVFHILLLLILAQTTAFAQVDSTAYVQAQADSIVVDNTIKETIKLDDVTFETIEREGSRYYAVTSDGHKEEITSMIDGKTRALVKDDSGHELVIDKDGNVMGVEEYKACGGSKLLLRENIKEKDSKVTKSGNVKFYGAGDNLFDTYDAYETHSASQGYAKRFPSIGEGNYRPAYACAESNGKIKLKAEPYKTYTFKNERGVPVLCKDGLIEVTARGDRDTTAVYAFDSDNNIVGKVNVMSYDKVTRKVCLVPMGIDKSEIKASEIKQGLDKKFAKLMVDFEVTVAERIDITYANGDKFLHGGSGVIGVYNDDQKSAISKLKETIAIDDETCYLFMVKNCMAKKADDSNDIVSGYMPRGYQFGFIYNELTNSRTIAHELSHGAFHLKHTFVADDDYIAPERSTDNLMDYAGGVTLNHWQWQDVHLPKSVRFKWLQDEEDGEFAIQLIQCLTAAAIDVAANYAFKWVELWYDDNPVDITDYNAIFGALNTAEVVTSAGVACATSVLPFPAEKAKLVSALAGGFGAGATALAADLEQQYSSISLQYPDKNVGDILSLVDWGRSLQTAGVQSLVGGVISGVSTYAATHPKFVNFTTKLKAIGYNKLKPRLVKAGLSDEVAESFCSKIGVTPNNVLSAKGDVKSSLSELAQSHPDAGKRFFDDFADATDDVLKKFVEKPELVDGWKRLRKIGVNEKIFKDVDALEAWINLESVSVSKVAPSVMQPLKTIGLTDDEIGKLISINRKASLGQATKAEIKLSQEIAEVCFDVPTKGEKITKYVSVEDFDEFHLNAVNKQNKKSSIGGFIAKESDYAQYNLNVSSEQLIVDFGLTYEGSLFTNNKGYVKIETVMTDEMVAAVKQPHLVNDAQTKFSQPQTFTGSLGHPEVDKITPEFYIDGGRKEIGVGAKAFEYDASGKEVKRWVYIIENGKLIWKEQ